MGKESKRPLKEAQEIADRIVDLLNPHCHRIAIAGSIRRERPLVGDVEIVAIPKPYETGLFASGIAAALQDWTTIKGQFPCKYTQRIHPASGMKVDIFFAEEGNYGLIMAIRTGSAEYSHHILAKGWTKAGFYSEGGWLHRKSDNKPVAVPQEADLFRMIGIPYKAPKEREYYENVREFLDKHQ